MIEIERFRKNIEDDKLIRNKLYEMIPESKDVVFQDDERMHFLDKFEVLAIKWKDDIISNYHIYEVFGVELSLIMDCDDIMKDINHFKDQKYKRYNHLDELLHKNEEWINNR